MAQPSGAARRSRALVTTPSSTNPLIPKQKLCKDTLSSSPPDSNIHVEEENSRYTSLIPILCRIWPLLLACKGVQFPADSLLGQLSDTKFLRANEEQHQHENSFDEVSCGSSATSPSTYDHWSPGKRQVLSTPSTASKSIPGPIRKGAEKRSDVSYPYRNAISREPPSTGRSSLPHSSSARRSSRSAIEQGRAHHMTDPAGEEASLEFGKTRKIGLGSEAMRLPPGNFGQLASLSACLNSTGEGVEDHLPASGTANPTIHGPPVDHYGLWTSEEASTLKTPPGVHADLWDSWIFDLSADADRNNTVSGSAPNCRTHHLL